MKLRSFGKDGLGQFEQIEIFINGVFKGEKNGLINI